MNQAQVTSKESNTFNCQTHSTYFLDTDNARKALRSSAKSKVIDSELQSIISDRKLGQLFVTRVVRAGQHLYWPGSPFEYVYIQQSGVMKTYMIDQSGIEQVTGFHNAGDWLGLEAVSCSSHVSAAKALIDTVLCAASFSAIDRYCASDSAWRINMWRQLTLSIRETRERMMMLCDMPAQQRIVTFLVNQYDSVTKQNSDKIVLHMTRSDIGSYLGLASETVSRWFTRLQHKGLIRIEGKNVWLDDEPGLRQIAMGIGVENSNW